MNEFKKIKKFNYMALFSVQRDIENAILKACPEMKHASGIYFYTRDEFDVDYKEHKKFAYIGKSVDVLKRSVSHIQGYQPVDLSLRKRGFYDETNNPEGWKLNVLFYPESKLNEMESKYIDMYLKADYELLNIESGGTNGKTMINDRKPAKGYMDGIKQGKKALARDLKDIIDKHLVVSIKKQSKISEKQFEKFNKLLETE